LEEGAFQEIKGFLLEELKGTKVKVGFFGLPEFGPTRKEGWEN